MRCGITQNENKQLCECWLSVFTKQMGSPSNYGVETNNKNFYTRNLNCTWNSNLYIYSCGDSFSVLFLNDKSRQLEAGNSDNIIWKIPSVKFVFGSAKVARPSSDPLIDPVTSFGSPIFRIHPHGYNFFVKFYPYGCRRVAAKCASNLFYLFPSEYDNLLQWTFSKLIHIGIRVQLDRLNT